MTKQRMILDDTHLPDVKMLIIKEDLKLFNVTVASRIIYFEPIFLN